MLKLIDSFDISHCTYLQTVNVLKIQCALRRKFAYKRYWVRRRLWLIDCVLPKFQAHVRGMFQRKRYLAVLMDGVLLKSVIKIQCAYRTISQVGYDMDDIFFYSILLILYLICFVLNIFQKISLMPWMTWPSLSLSHSYLSCNLTWLDFTWPPPHFYLFDLIYLDLTLHDLTLLVLT